MKSVKNKNRQYDINKILIGLVSLSLIIVFSFMMKQEKLLKIENDGQVHIDTISAGVQRIAKLVFEGDSDYELMIAMENSYNELLTENNKYFTKDDRINALVGEYLYEMTVFQLAVQEFRENGVRENLFTISESHYKFSETISKELNIYVAEMSKFIDTLERILIGHVIIIALLLVKILFNTHKELQKNKELSAGMYIDTSTGLYNRSKCQEILRNTDSLDPNKERAVLIFDLNDLKKTNDGLGHRAGDDLISSFALQLKNATEVFSYEVFVGRYGGDEFMAYFSSTVEDDVKLYLKEVDYLMDKFNESGEKPFKLSCAAGYCITKADTKNMTMRELFDTADETMYKNKLAMKEKKRQELAEKGIVEPTVIDERLL